MKELNIDDFVVENTPIIVEKEDDVVPIKYEDYMYTDSNFVGYPSKELQESIYYAVTFGDIIQPSTRILDVGSGRSDLLLYIMDNIYGFGHYTGIEHNTLLYNIAKEKTEHIENVTLINEVFNSDTVFKTDFDYVFHITNLTLDYGVNSYDDKYENFRSMIEKSLEICTQGVVLMLLNDFDNDDTYITHNIGKITEICHSMNLKYAVDHTDFGNIYKLLILKN